MQDVAAKVASQQLPDVIILQAGNARELIEEGAIIPITEYLEKARGVVYRSHFRCMERRIRTWMHSMIA